MPNFRCPTVLTQAQQSHDDESSGNVRELNDSVYLVALRKTAPAAAISAVGFTVVIYLVFANILALKEAFQPLPIAANYKTFSSDVVVVLGLVIALVLWLVLGYFYESSTSARCANRRNYNLLLEKLHRLNTRISTVKRNGYGPEGFHSTHSHE